MSAIQGIVSGLVTIALMGVFLAIWYWAWRPRHRKAFDELAELPLEDLGAGSTIPQTGAGSAREGDASRPAAAQGEQSR